MGELLRVFIVGVAGVFVVMAVLYFVIILVGKVATGIAQRTSHDS